MFEEIITKLSSEPIGPILDSIFKWAIYGPMVVVDNVILPITDVITGPGLLLVIGILFSGYLYYRYGRVDQSEPETLPEVDVNISAGHPRYGKR